MFEDPSNSWHALHVRSRHEKFVSAQLQVKQQEVFLPLYAAKRRWADRWKTVSLPLFPGYVFCRFGPQHLSTVLRTSGVIDCVRSGCEPASIDSKQIESIQLAVNSTLLTEPYAGLAKGQQVMMTDGPLRGMIGTLIEMRGNFRLVLSVELLQRSVLVEIQRDWVAALEPDRTLPYMVAAASKYGVA